MTKIRLSLSPVFAYEWMTTTRRWQPYAQRSLFVSLLLLALVIIWVNTDRTIHASAIRYLAALGQGFLLAVTVTQLTLVLLAAPAVTAGSICLDRARGTLTHMLVTDLSATEIVLGKLAARLIPVLGVLACMLPVLELLSLLGGVDPTALLGGFVVTVGVAVLGCSMAMTFSLWVGKTHEALLCTYGIWCLWLLAGPMVGLLASTIGWPWLTPPRSLQPFLLALAPYWSPGSVGWSDYLLFLAVTLSTSAALVGVAVLRLRLVCTHESVRKMRRSPLLIHGGKIWRLLNSTIPWLTPSLDGNPVVWREWHRSRPSRWTMLIIFIYAGLSLLFSIVAILWPRAWMVGAVNAFQVSIGLLLLSVTAATSLAEERAHGSLDLLLSTPLSTRQIVVGKWLGTFRLVPLLAILPAIVIGATGLTTGSRNSWAFLLMIAFVLCAGGAIVSLGMALATTFSRVGRALGLTVTVYVLVTVGWVVLVGSLYGTRSEKLVMGNPLFWAAQTTMEEMSGYGMSRQMVAQAIFWTVFYGLVSAGLLLTTLRSFDRRLSRLDDVVAWSCFPSRSLRAITFIYFAWAISFTFFLFFSPRESNSLPYGSGLLFSLGLLLLAVTASWPLIDVPFGNETNARLATSSVLVAKWAASGRLVPWVVILPLMVAFNSNGPISTDWLPLVIMLVCMLCVCAATVSLGVATFVWCRGRVWAIAFTTALWGLAHTGWIALGSGGALDPRALDLYSSHPFAGVITLTLWMRGISASDFRALAWSVAASTIYAALAGVLFLVALSRSDPSSTRVMRGSSRQRYGHPQLTTNN